MDSNTEKRLVGQFVLWAASLKEGRGALCSPEHVEVIKAAAERLTRQAAAASTASRARQNHSGGRKRGAQPHRTTIWREKKKAGK